VALDPSSGLLELPVGLAAAETGDIEKSPFSIAAVVLSMSSLELVLVSIWESKSMSRPSGTVPSLRVRSYVTQQQWFWSCVATAGSIADGVAGVIGNGLPR
jgi:hypothetical protein